MQDFAVDLLSDAPKQKHRCAVRLTRQRAAGFLIKPDTVAKRLLCAESMTAPPLSFVLVTRVFLPCEVVADGFDDEVGVFL
jgi:hypothetical protein